MSRCCSRATISATRKRSQPCLGRAPIGSYGTTCVVCPVPRTAAPIDQGSRCLFILSPSEPADVANYRQSENEIRRGEGVLAVQVDLEFGRLIAVDTALNDRVPIIDRGA